VCLLFSLPIFFFVLEALGFILHVRSGAVGIVPVISLNAGDFMHGSLSFVTLSLKVGDQLRLVHAAKFVLDILG